MLKKIVFNLIVFIVIVMIGAAVLKANKPRSNALKADLNSVREQKSGLVPREAKYYRVIEE